jgi:pimeloyl-ACP methyl ester carboxylesterase
MFGPLSMLPLLIVSGTNLLPNRPRRTSALRIVSILLINLVLLGAVTLAAGLVIETVRMRRLGSYPPQGTTYKIGDYSSHLVCTGVGSPTLVLEAGLGDDFLSWRRVQPALSGITRVCSYDRAGYGWSSSRPGPRDTDHVAEELHALVAKAHIEGPIILMGHSAGGLFIRKYASLYPQGIVGMVFVDASTPTQVERLPAEFGIIEDFTWDKLFLPFGITRLRGHCGVTDPSTPALEQQLEWHDCTRNEFATSEQEERDFSQSCIEARDTGPFGDIPILILSQDPELHFGELPFSLATLQRAATTWNTLQEELKQLSPRSRRVIARGSTHYIQILRPELVIREVEQMIGEIRGNQPPRQDYGSTILQ